MQKCTADSQVISNWSSKLRNGVEVDIVSVDGEESAPAPPAEEEATEKSEDTKEDTEESEQTEEET